MSVSVLALDIGSSSTRAALFDDGGHRTAKVCGRSYKIRYGHGGAAELSPHILREAVRAVVACFKSKPSDVVAASAFWHGLLGLDAKRRPITPIYTWADSRCQSDAAELRQNLSGKEALQHTGCMLRFCFWPAKLRWLLRTDRALFCRVRFWVSPSDWIWQELFDELATSESMASATGLLDQTKRTWDAAMCDAAGIDESHLPPIRDSLCDDGSILTAIGDGTAGNIGSGAISEKIAAVNLGTSAAVRIMTRRRLRIASGLFRFSAGEQRFVLGGAISNAGNLRDWCERQLRLPRSARIERAPAATDSLIALPFLVAERAPDWPEFSGAIAGYNFATTPLEIFRASMTPALYRLADIFDLLEQSIGRLDRIIVSGGMTKSAGVVDILADALGGDLELASETDASLRGAALHALKEYLPPGKSARLVRFNKEYTKVHRARRKKQHAFARALSAGTRL